jgi:hypothetical protein
MDMEAVLERVLAEFAEATAELEAAQEKVRRLQVMRDGLETAIAEFGGREDAMVATPEGNAADLVAILPGIPQPPESGETLPIVELAKAAMTGLGREAGTNEILERMAAGGYSRTYEQVRGALSWMKKQGKIEHTGPGMWVLPPESQPSDLVVAPPVTAAKPNANGQVPAGAVTDAGRRRIVRRGTAS